ncbi:uncharacterized protein EI90DRAFT_2929844, partial [Cantharellus anzutake]|uniref:uncharacterized protein n=1 Tax=Cantharellus anzutake TaxID=1750568 RepID=UPI001907A380
EKIDGFRITKSSMLTTRGQDGFLHSRVMASVNCKSTRISFLQSIEFYLYSPDEEELEHDPHVDVSFYDPSTTNWISVARIAKLSSDHDRIKRLWNTSARAWFGDLGDGVHMRNETDPRVSIIEVIPEKI